MSDPPITTEASGVGTQPFGSSPYGLGTPATVNDEPAASAGSRYLNPFSKDYQIDPNTDQAAQMPPTRQRVLIAVMTVLNSATAIPGLGLRAPRKIGINYIAQTKASVRASLAHLVIEDAPVIEIERIDVIKLGVGRILVTISYIDLLTGLPDTTETIIQ